MSDPVTNLVLRSGVGPGQSPSAIVLHSFAPLGGVLPTAGGLSFFDGLTAFTGLTAFDGLTWFRGVTRYIPGTISEDPIITSDGGGTTASVSVNSPDTDVTTVTATGTAPVTFMLSGGADVALFQIAAADGTLTFVDASVADTYEVIVAAVNLTGSDTQTITVTVLPPYVGPLDLVPGAVVAYGQRAMAAADIGSTVYTIRRSSDDTTQAFVSQADGSVDATAVAAFIGGGNGFVSAWNDYGSAGENAVQATAGLQPGWTANVANGKPALSFVSNLSTTGSVLGTAGNVTLPNLAYTVFAVAKGTLDPAVAGNQICGINADVYDINAWLVDGNSPSGLFKTDAFVDGATYAETGWSDSGSTVADTAHVIEIAWDIASGFHLIDGVAQSVTQTYNHPGTNSSITNPLAVGAGDVTLPHGYLNMPLLELIIYPTLLSSGDRTLVRQNIADYYGITL